jgi:hypothetical protein
MSGRGRVKVADAASAVRWAYLRASLHRVPGRTEKKNPNPYDLSSEALVQTSGQVTEYMLCANCEQRFGVDETYASKLAYQPDGTATLFNQI